LNNTQPLPSHLHLVAPSQPDASGSARVEGLAALDRGARTVEDAGSPLSLERAFRSHAPFVASVAFRILGSREETEDMVQEVFLELRRWLDRIHDAAALRAWLTTVTVREARRRLKRRRLHAVFGFADALDYALVAASTATPAERALVSEIYRILDRVPTDARLAWTLRHVAGATLPEVAEHCSCSLATAKRRIARAQAVIAEELRDT
jgi:RNA polymerase sigma-70 factor, ECF subfamily